MAIQTLDGETVKVIANTVQALALAAIAMVVSVLVSRQNKLAKVTDEIKVDVNSKSTKQSEEIAALRATIAKLEDTPGVLRQLENVVRILLEQNATSRADNRDAAMDRRLVGMAGQGHVPPMQQAAPAVPAVPAVPAASTKPTAVTVVQPIDDPLPVKMVDEPLQVEQVEGKKKPGKPTKPA